MCPGVHWYFRANAGFAKPEVYEYLEEGGFLYAIRHNPRFAPAYVARDVASVALGHINTYS